MSKINVTVWNEFRHEQNNEAIRKIYPEGMHKAIAAGIAADDLNIRTATLDEPNCGLPDEVLYSTDVLVWWGHIAHNEVPDELVAKIQRRVLEGMGLIVLHSSHFSKIFRALMGTTCSLRWREAGERERLWNIAPNHPITQGVGQYIELPHVEMYGERFDIPDDGKLIFISWYEGGDVFRSGVTFERGHGKIFYFSPGHESFPIFYDQKILKVIGNAVRWAKSPNFIEITCPCVEALEEIKKDDSFVSVGVVQDV